MTLLAGRLPVTARCAECEAWMLWATGETGALVALDPAPAPAPDDPTADRRLVVERLAGGYRVRTPGMFDHQVIASIAGDLYIPHDRVCPNIGVARTK
jgi:hypothetical protein